MARYSSVRRPAFSGVLLFALLVFASSSVAAQEFSALSAPLTGGDTANLPSVTPAIDDSGDVVVFASTATNLVEGDVSSLSDVFVYTRETGGVTSITLGANGNSGLPQISPDGRYVVFVSNATNLADDNTVDSNGPFPNVFLYDRQTETTTIGPPVADFELNARAYISETEFINVDIADDGQVVLFESLAEELRSTNSGSRPLYHLWFPGTGEIITIEPQADSPPDDVDLSDDGSFAVFISSASNLLPQVFPERRNRLYRYDIQTETSELLVDAGIVRRPAISGDGRHVAFFSVELNAQPSARTDAPTDLFTMDLLSREIVFIDGDGPPVMTLNTQDPSDIDITSDGSKIVFTSGDLNLVAGDTNGATDVYVWDRDSDRITNLTMEADLFSIDPALNASGDAIVFTSAATNLLASADLNGVLDVLITRDDETDAPVCELTASGVLSSTSGVTVNLQGNAECFGRGLFSYGTPSNAGITVPAIPGRPELNLFPQNSRGLPENDLIFFTYPSTNGETLYATNFVTRDNAYHVSMTFRSDSPELFTLFELVVFESTEFDRRRLVYREQDTQWTFSSEGADNVLNLSVLAFRDINDDNFRSNGERVAGGLVTTLFRCGDSDGLVSARRLSEDGATTYAALEPGFYQLSVQISSSLRFSSPAFDRFGSQINVIRATVPGDFGSVIGFTDCTDFTDEVSEFGPIGVLPR